MENSKACKNREGGRIAGGLILIAVGAALFVRNMGYVDLPYWLFTWPMILILIGIYQAVKSNFSNMSWLVITAVGVFFLVDKFIPDIKLEPAFWPLIIAGLGLVFILRPGKKKYIKTKNYPEANDELVALPEITDATMHTDTSDYLRVDSVFSGVDRTILTKNFQGGKISCVFGGAEIDLLRADINGKVKIKIDVVFGGVKLIIPSNWSVQSEIDGAFHNIDDKRKHIAGTTIDPNKVLYLKGSCVFGGIEIKSY